MPKIDVDAVLAAKAPRIARWVPGFVIRWLKRTIHQDEINYILDEYSALPPQQFIQACFKFWGVTYSVEGLENLDPKGRYLFASNHPFGGMDGMMLADELVGYFGDARVIVNDLLMHVEPLRPLWIPVNKHGSQCGEYLRRFDEAFASDCPILTFRPGFVRAVGRGWCPICRGVRISSSGRRVRAPDRAGFVEGELSDFFYRLSNFRTKIGIRFNIEMLYLPDEMFSQKGKHFRILVGEPVSTDELVECGSWQQRADYVREKAYSLEKKLRAEAKHG